MELNVLIFLITIAFYFGIIVLIICLISKPTSIYNYNQNNFKLEKYLGYWDVYSSTIEIWEKFYSGDLNYCAGQSATYSNNNNFVDVLNKCLNYQGDTLGEIRGFATQENNKGIFKIKFENIPTIGNYIIYKTDYYSYSLVGDGENSLWILQRKNVILSPKTLESLYNLAEKYNYTTSKLVKRFIVN